MKSKPLDERSNDLNNLILIIQDHQKCIKYVVFFFIHFLENKTDRDKY